MTPTYYHYHKLLKIRQELYTPPFQRRTVQELAEQAHLSLSRFQHLYKEFFHTTASKDMIFARMEYAKQLLTTTNLSIKQIADELDYKTCSVFIRQFKTLVGSSPGLYKNRSISNE